MNRRSIDLNRAIIQGLSQPYIDADQTGRARTPS
jgi:hypothetical protein